MIIALSIALFVAILYIVVDRIVSKLTKMGGFTIQLTWDDDDEQD